MHLRRRTKIGLWCTTIFAFVAAGLLSSIAWFDRKQNAIEADVTGSVVEEYFHCGTGTQSDPYVITRPIHYYHLVEFFQRLTNLPKTGGYSQFGTDYLYFQVGYDLDGSGIRKVYNYSDTGVYLGSESTPSLSTTLNMAYYSGENALLPIGTNEVPFIGSFDGGATDGGGITINNLNIQCSESVLVGNNTVTRTASDIGVFGYVADKDGNDAQTVIQNAYFTNLTLDLSDIGATANTSQSTISHIDSHTAPYVGYIAGHVHSYTNYNGTGPVNATPLHDVYVNGATILGGAGVNCNYGYIGKVDTIDGQATTGNEIASQVQSLQQGAGNTGWGGSIHMQGLYNRINAYEEEYYTHYTGQPEVNGRDYAGKVDSLLRQNNVRDIHFLGGSDDETIIGSAQSRGTEITYTISSTETRNAFYIKAGTNYLNLSENGDLLETTSSADTLWAFSGGTSGYLYTILNAKWPLSNQLSLTRNNVVRFLGLVGGQLVCWSLTPDRITDSQWSMNSSNQIVSASDTTQVLCYDGSDWVTRANGVARNAFRLYYGEPRSYAAISGSKVLGGYSADDATIFFPSVASGNRYDVTGVNESGTLRYLYSANLLTTNGSSPGNNYKMMFFAASYKGSSSAPQDDYYLGSYYNGSQDYRFKFSNNSSNNFARERPANGNNAALYLRVEMYTETITASSAVQQSTLPKITWSLGSTVPASETYIPLNVESNSLAASNDNVGYIVSGVSYSDSTYRGDVRVARYGYNYLNTSITGNNATVYTIGNSTGSVARTTINDTLVVGDDATTSTASATISSLGFSKYYDYTSQGRTMTGARTALFRSLTENTEDVYGLHFMNATVGSTNKFAATDIRVNGKTYPNSESSIYELPRDCISFNLKEEGLITFFAGTYFDVGKSASENNCFFSLSEITRSGGTITNIRKIYKIYRKKDSTKAIEYTYDSSSTKSTTDYDLVFDTDWITKPKDLDSSYWTNNALYYFEIPVSAGDYALGSINESGKNGAYLLYLDIGANGNQGTAYNVENAIASTPLFTQIGFTTGGYVINSCFNIAYVIPAGSDKEKFSIQVSVRTNVSYNGQLYTCYDVVVVNTSGNNLTLHCLLTDDDSDPTNTYLFMFSVQYNGGTANSYIKSNSFTGTSGATSMTPTYT